MAGDLQWGVMSWFKRTDANIGRGSEGGSEFEASAADSTYAPVSDDGEAPRVRTEGLWIKCDGCRQPLFKAELEANLYVCPKCGYHFKMGARERIDLLLEPGYKLVDGNMQSTDPLNFTDIKTYKSRLVAAQKRTGLNDAIITALGKLGPHDVVLSAMEYTFIGGSMGAVVGGDDCAGDRPFAGREEAADYCFGIGWGAHDGRRGEPDAVGEDCYGSGAVG